MEKFKGEIAYAILCPHCDENMLCRVEDESDEDSGLTVCIYPTMEDAAIARKAIMDDWSEETKLPEPKIIMVKIDPIKYTTEVDSIIK